ncbi:hypothetical protein CEXT_551521 [Caerostris extrusa]|uniref:Uncharacterized protein n=1 Tax=Caerostris extrusa TaxID=172846 RepID=A0AAV4STP2_CAEEX|nr:hypothetical protein CEXT_551521 [Caerostris extrusa]
MRNFPGLKNNLKTPISHRQDEGGWRENFIALSFDSFLLLPDFSPLSTFRGKWISHFGDRTEGGCLPPLPFLRVWNDVSNISIVCFKLQSYVR